MALVGTKVATAARTCRSGRHPTSRVSRGLENVVYIVTKVVVFERPDHMGHGLADAFGHDTTVGIYSEKGLLDPKMFGEDCSRNIGRRRYQE